MAQGKNVYLKTPGIVQQMLRGYRMVIHQEPLLHNGVLVPNIEYDLTTLGRAMKWFEHPVCLEDMNRAE